MKATKAFSIAGLCTGIVGLVISVTSVTFSLLAFFRGSKR